MTCALFCIYSTLVENFHKSQRKNILKFQLLQNIIGHPLHVESKKKWYKWTYFQNIDSQKGLENELMVAGGEGTVKNFGKGMYILLY